MGRKTRGTAAPHATRDMRRKTPRKHSGAANRAPSRSGPNNPALQAIVHQGHVLPLRRSERIRAKGVVSYVTPGEPISASSGIGGSEYGRPNTPTPSYMPYRSKEIGLATPRRRVVIGDPRPRAEDLAKVAPSGLDCGLTGLGSSMGTNQTVHHIPRATDKEDLTNIETTFGEDPGGINLDSRANLMRLDAAKHAAYDATGGHCAIVPELPLLTKLYTALEDKEVQDWDKDRPPHKNAAGFIHHEEVFPLDGTGRVFHFVPTMNWDKNHWITVTKRLSNGEDETTPYQAPFTDPEDGSPLLPPMILHCSPYFVVYKTYQVLVRTNARLPAWAHGEEMLVRLIGDIMTGKTAPEAKN